MHKFEQLNYQETTTLRRYMHQPIYGVWALLQAVPIMDSYILNIITYISIMIIIELEIIQCIFTWYLFCSTYFLVIYTVLYFSVCFFFLLSKIKLVEYITT